MKKFSEILNIVNENMSQMTESSKEILGYKIDGDLSLSFYKQFEDLHLSVSLSKNKIVIDFIDGYDSELEIALVHNIEITQYCVKVYIDMIMGTTYLDDEIAKIDQSSLDPSVFKVIQNLESILQ